MFSAFKKKLASLKEGLETEVAKFNNKDFLEATAAACALVAAADGSIDAEEKQKMAGFMKISPELKVFDPTEGFKLFSNYAEQFEFDFAIGKQAVMEAIVAKVGGDSRAASTMLRVACAVGAADGDFDDDEKAQVADMARTLQLSPSDFGV